MSEEKRQKLKDAIERIKAGVPLYIKASRKLSHSSVEDEARLGKSILRTKGYQDLFELVTNEKNKLNTNTSSVTKDGKLTSKADNGIKELKKKNKSLKKELRELENKYKLAIKYNAELTHVINTKRFTVQLDKITEELNDNITDFEKKL